MAANLFRRYVWLLDLISHSGGITFDDISDKWESAQLNDRQGEPLSKKTFHNHINAIEEMFDIRIVCQRQGGFRYVLEGADGGELSNAQELLIQRLRISNALIANPRLSERFLLDKSLEYKHINPLISAMNDSHRLHVSYWRVGDERDKRREFTLEPYFVKQFSKEWFVVGRIVEEKKIRVLSFTSIRKLEPLKESFEYPEEFDIKSFIDSHLNMLDLESGELKGKDTATDDSAEFALQRFRDTFPRRSTYGSFTPDEVL